MVAKKNSVGDFIADVMPKVKVYLFLSICVILLNISVVIVSALNNISIPNPLSIGGELPDSYKTMSNDQRKDYLYDLHGGPPIINIDATYFYFPDGFAMSPNDYSDFVTGKATAVNFIDYSKSSDTEFASKTVGTLGSSFLPFASILVNVDFYANYFPISIIMILVISMISAVQLYVLFAMVLNHLPFFNI